MECWRNNEKYHLFCCSASLHLLHCTLKESEAFCKPFPVHLLNHVWCDLLRIWNKSIISSLCFQLPVAFSPFPHGPTGILSEKKYFFPYFSQSAHIHHTLLKHIGVFFFFPIGHKNEESCTLNVMHTLYTIRVHVIACHYCSILNRLYLLHLWIFLGFPTKGQSFRLYWSIGMKIYNI